MTLTGAQIKALAQNGKHAALYEGENRPRRTESEEGAIATANFDYYWAGMTVERDKEKIAAITLEDGTVMEDDKTYTVLFAPGDYTEEVAAVGNPVELGYTANELFLEYLQKNSPVSPIAVTR